VDSLQTIERQIEDHHVLKHPFYIAWQEGTLPREALRTYAAQYYQHVRAFPTYISALHSRCDDLETRQALLENLRDEEEGAENHPALWLRFAAAVGCAEGEAESAEPLPETQAAIYAFRAAVREGTVTRGLAALWAYESMVPAVAAEKIRGLAEHYGVVGSPATDYFEVHRTLDIEHAATTRELVARRVADAAEASEAEVGAARAVGAIALLLDGVCRVHGIARAA
jgi:pyrroloquinoline-quinone synthase